MKSKKLIPVIISLLFAICITMNTTKVDAVSTLATPIYFGVQEYRSGTTPNNIGYAINNPYDNGSTTDSIVGTKIWDIVRYSSSTATTFDTAENLYCVRAGVGFRNTSEKAMYNISYNLKTEREAIVASNNTVLQSIVNNGQYYKLLALTDILYLNNISTENDKIALLEAAGIYEEDYTAMITDSDIEAVQQAAIWYFTNHDDQLFDRVFDNMSKDIWLYYRTLEMEQNGDTYTSLSDYDMQFNENGAKVGSGMQREEQANLLYRYLINKATENSTAYENGTANSKTKVTLYANATEQNTQPIILIEREIQQKEFDLALRKYITKIDGVQLSQADTRVPNIDLSTLKEGTTATYNHRKDPVTVKTGTVVTYNLTVYNEGEKAGRATQIIDQLPTGLRFSKLNTSGFTPNYNETTNRLTITRDATNTNNLEAYTEGRLQSETIEIECVVTMQADTKNQIVLTNIAWISQEYDAVDNVTIVTEQNKDRDSEPGTVPNANKDNMSSYIGNNNKTDLADSNYYYKGQQDDDDFEKLVLEPQTFDLKLIKRITKVNGNKVDERILNVDITKLANGTATTADYNLNKEPISVKKGDLITYTLRVYNEGDIDGYASEITEDIPEGLEFVWSEKTGEELQKDATLTDAEKEAVLYNQGIWDIKTVNTQTNRVEEITTDYLAKGKGAEIAQNGANLIQAFDKEKAYTNLVNEKNPDYKEISVVLKVVSNDGIGTIIRNEAAITEDTDSDGNPIDDRDSDTEKWVKYEDDEDYDNVKLQSFDLTLRKFTIAVSKDTNIEESEYLKNSDGKYTRAPIVDTSKLNTIDENEELITTAIYNHSKEPVEVRQNDIVVYMLRVYNEGEIDGYASEIKDHLPEYLEFVNGEFNTRYGWTVSEDGRTVTTKYLENSIIDKAQSNANGNIILSYKEVPIMCKVKDTAKVGENITNIADITEYRDENKQIIEDRDSEPNNVILPDDKDLPSYKDDEKGSYVPGQEDDDDFEKLIIKPFDLALRKFITQVNEQTVTSRIPQVKYDSTNNKITYEHTKEPVEVVADSTVIYTIRVYNEGEVDGYASRITDDIPQGLEFLPQNSVNKEYRWVMYDANGNVTEDVMQAAKITTDYLSKEQGEERMKQDNTLTENPALLSAFDKEKNNIDYAEVKVAFKVVQSSTSNNIIINSAQISEDTDKDGNDIDDIDSTPDKWIDEEDDQDKEYIKLTYFDLALRKWVTQAIVIENGKETITETGHTPEQDPEPVVKVDIHRKKINSVTVKFRYSIRITNEGDIAGYAKEITDYVPEGLKFVAGDNNGWVDEGNNVISTRLLENKLLQPGESADVEVVLTWINNKDNMGLKTNIAEISEDYNDKGAKDIDSTPDNKKDGEDDIDDAPVILAISTGQVRIYFTLSFIVLITIAGGIVLIKKFVL